jgi:D-apionolactonase
VHAFDEGSIVETAQAQADTVSSARAFSGGKPIVVGPVTLLPRFNPYAAGSDGGPAPGELPVQVDPRQMSLFAAAWTVASAKHLAESGAAAVTYYETTGWQGVLETEDGPPLPERFPSRPGMVFPVYHALADLAERKRATLAALESSAPLAVEGLALVEDDRSRLLLACLVPGEQHVVLEGLPDGTASVRRLNEDTAEAALLDPEAFRSSKGEALAVSGGRLELDLLPFELARFDLLRT